MIQLWWFSSRKAEWELISCSKSVMRFIGDHSPPEEEVAEPMAGTLLLAHPSLMDLNFRHSVVLLTAHSAEDGSLGVVVNRPLGKTLGEYDPGLSTSDLADIPLYAGGPVAAGQMILAAWRWAPEDGTFKLYFGIDADKARTLMQSQLGYQLYGFLGHAGWTEGQLEVELEQGAWLLSPLTREMDTLEEAVWRAILSVKVLKCGCWQMNQTILR